MQLRPRPSSGLGQQQGGLLKTDLSTVQEEDLEKRLSDDRASRGMAERPSAGQVPAIQAAPNRERASRESSSATHASMPNAHTSLESSLASGASDAAAYSLSNPQHQTLHGHGTGERPEPPAPATLASPMWSVATASTAGATDGNHTAALSQLNIERLSTSHPSPPEAAVTSTVGAAAQAVQAVQHVPALRCKARVALANGSGEASGSQGSPSVPFPPLQDRMSPPPLDVAKARWSLPAPRIPASPKGAEGTGLALQDTMPGGVGGVDAMANLFDSTGGSRGKSGLAEARGSMPGPRPQKGQAMEMRDLVAALQSVPGSVPAAGEPL